MTLDEFGIEYQRLADMGLSAGIRHGNLAQMPGPDNPISGKEYREFVARCHRGYDKAQRYAVQLIERIQQQSTDVDEAEWEILHVRKILDAIGYALLGGRTYVLRRLSIHSTTPNIDIKTLQLAEAEARKRNAASRLTFSLVADLTTFLHVADLLTIDFRFAPAKVSMIELKSGKVNTILLQELEKYVPSEEAIKQVENDPSIADGYRKQAKRMLRQRLRLAQIDEILRTDRGTDPQLKVPLRLSKEFLVEDEYDEFVDDLFSTATREGQAAGSYGWCLHFGVGSDDDPKTAKQKAVSASLFAASSHLSAVPDEVREVVEEVRKQIPPAHALRLIDVIQSNISTVSTRPFPAWAISQENRRRLVTKNLVFTVAFDIGGFIAMGKELGIPMRLLSRSETSKRLDQIPKGEKITWGNRALAYTVNEQEAVALSGMFGRFVNNLTNPVQFMRDAQRSGFG